MDKKEHTHGGGVVTNRREVSLSFVTSQRADYWYKKDYVHFTDYGTFKVKTAKAMKLNEINKSSVKV